MTHRRTGSGQPTPAILRWLGYCVLVGFLLGGLLFVRNALGEAFDREGALRRLSEGPSPAQQQRRMQHFGGTIRVERGGIPLCYYRHQYYVSGKNGGWRTDQEWYSGYGLQLHTTDGQYLPILVDRLVAFDPASVSAVADADDVRRRYPWVRAGGRIESDCAGDGDSVFIEGCFREGALRACGDFPLTVTWGQTHPQRRIDRIANDIAGKATVGLLFFAALFLSVWGLLFKSSQMQTLLQWAKYQPPAFGAWILGGQLVLELLILGGYWLQYVTYARRGTDQEIAAFGHLFLVFTVVFLFSLAFIISNRVRVLRRVSLLMDQTPTSKLAVSTEGNVELAVTVSKDNKTVETKLWSGVSAAAIHVRLFGVSGTGKQQSIRLIGEGTYPSQLRIKDASGEGVLFMKHVDVDANAQWKRFTLEEYLSQAEVDYRKMFPSFTLPAGVHTVDVEESVLELGEPLYVYGAVKGVSAGEGQTYRVGTAVPEIGGSEDSKLILHAGTEQSLRETLRSEQQFATGFVLLAALAGVATLLFEVWLVSR